MFRQDLKLNDPMILAVVNKEWGLGVQAINFIDTGSTFAFELKVSHGQKFFLKIYLIKDMSVKVIDSTLKKLKKTASVLQQLNHSYEIKNITTFIPALNKEWAIKNGNYIFILSNFFTGFHPLPDRSNLNHVQLAELFTKLHQLPYKNFPEINNGNFDIRYAVGFKKWLVKDNLKISGLNQEMIYRIQNQLPFLLKKLETLLQLKKRFTGMDIGRVLTHGDAHHFNILQNEDDLYLIDWDNLKIGPPERDLWHYHKYSNLIDHYNFLNPGFKINNNLCRYYRIQRFLEDIRYYFEENKGSAAQQTENTTNFLDHWGWQD